jgi:hypothetical protein
MAPAPRSHSARRAERTRKRARAQEDVEQGTTLDELIDLVLPFLPPGLVRPTRASRLRATAEAVPADLVARFALECPLHSDVADAEVLFCADSETGGMQMLAGRHPLVNLPGTVAASVSWSPVVRFCTDREPGGGLHRATRDVWVDLAQPDEPSFSFGMRLEGLVEAPRRPLEVLLRSLELGLQSLRGAPLASPALNSMRALVRRLPETARVDRAGLVSGRPDHVRLWLSRMTTREIVDLVEVTRDAGEARAIGAVLADLRDGVASIRVRLDVHEGVDRGIALICGVDPAGSPPQVAARWRPLLDRLVETGLCTDNRRTALLACYGLLREGQVQQWPAHLTKLSELFGDETESILHWRLHDVAVDCDRGEPVSATAHVVGAHGWARR